MPAYMVFNAYDVNFEKLGPFQKAAEPVRQRYDAKVVCVGSRRSAEVLEGSSQPDLVGIIEFADRQTALDFWRDDEYQEATQLRREAGNYDIFLIDGDIPPGS